MKVCPALPHCWGFSPGWSGGSVTQEVWVAQSPSRHGNPVWPSPAQELQEEAASHPSASAVGLMNTVLWGQATGQSFPAELLEGPEAS